MWSTPSSMARRSTARAAAGSAGGPKTRAPASCIAPNPVRLTVWEPSRAVCGLVVRFSSSNSGRSFLEQAFGEDDLAEPLHGLRAGPIALELAGERDPAERPASRLNEPLEAGGVRGGGRAGDRVGHGVDVIAPPQRVEGRE